MYKDFFQLKSVSSLRELSFSFPVTAEQECALESAPGRVLAQKFYADCDWPMHSRSSMDGFAVRAADTFGAGEFSPAYLDITSEVRIDRPPNTDIQPGGCARIVTGGILPDSADAVVMFEQTKEMGDGCLEVRKPVAPGENIMLRSEDATQGDLLLSPGTRIGFRESGLLAAFGGHRVRVYRPPAVGIISTGDEIIAVDQRPTPGLVRDVNRYALVALVRECGANPVCYGAVPDDYQALLEAVSRAAEENDVVLISGGSSVGTRDLTVKVLEGRPGSRILAHGVALSPGKPTILSDFSSKAVW
ncbi:MAG: molybdopterin molybdotransferase MoeA, partial [Desulfonatronovibrionaceae bacterium]